MAEDDSKKGLADGTVSSPAGPSASPDQTGRVPGAGEYEDPVTAPGDEAGAPGAVRPPEGAGATVAGANDPATEEGDRVSAPDHTLPDESERAVARGGDQDAVMMAADTDPPRGAVAGQTPHEREVGGDQIDSAAEEEALPGERPHVDDPDGAAMPMPGTGGVVAPGGADAKDDLKEGMDRAGEGAGTGNRGAAGGVPPKDGSAYEAAGAQERSIGALRERGEAPTPPASAIAPGWAARESDPSLFDADGPTAAEAGPDGAYVPATDTEAGLHALGAEAGRKPWVLWVMGAAAIVAGMLALAMPLVSSLAASVFVAAMLLASGAIGLVTSFRNREGTDQAMGFALSALSVVAGGVMLLAPLAGIIALSSLIIAFFAASGALKIWYGLKHEDAKGRGWLIAAGALSIILALFLWTGFPEAALWLPGVLLAVELIMTGTLLVALAIWGKPKLDLPGEAA